LAAAVRAGFERSSGGHGALAALAFLLFILLYTPCMAVVAAERQEFGGRWAWVSIVGQLAVAWGAAFLLFQGGLWLGVG
ncbi:MAG: ferrous iron transport protein B, partial [Caldilineales bacterium]|nr:ferrous iron transport protein B [Caldilineales bacterium]